MNRRMFICSSCSAAVFPIYEVGAFQGRAAAETTWYPRATGGLMTILTAMLSPGDFSNRRNVARFLRETYDLFVQMHLAKLEIRSALVGANCVAGAPPPSRALRAISELVRLRGQLRQLLLRLGRAVRPINMERAMTDLSTSLGELYDEKSWVNQVPRFCQLGVAERRQILRDIDTSISALGNAHGKMDDLLGRLRS
jgi:hypothetical protein